MADDLKPASWRGKQFLVADGDASPFGKEDLAKMMPGDTLKAFEALCADVVQFDDHPSEGDGDLFSRRVPPHMKSCLVNWLRVFVAEHGDTVRDALRNAVKRGETA